MHVNEVQHEGRPCLGKGLCLCVEWMVEAQGFEKKAANEHLFHLFPHGYMQQGCKIAGMQHPHARSTG